MSTNQEQSDYDDNDAQEPAEEERQDDIPEGKYEARGIEGSEQLGTADTGTEQVVIDLELLDLKRQVSTILPFTEAAMPYSLKRLRALGWEGGDSFAGISKNVVPVIVKYETYQGKRQMRVDIYTGQGRVVLKNTMNDQEKRGFFAKLNEYAKRETSGGPAPSSGAAATGSKGYPADWDKKGGGKGPPPADGTRPPRVSL